MMSPLPLPRPLMLLPDPRYPSTHVRSWYQGELQTKRDLYLAEMIGMENPNSKTTRLSITVVHASDGSTLSYNKLVCKMRLRRDGTRYHRITIPGVGGCETVSEAVQLVLADAARRREAQVTEGQADLPAYNPLNCPVCGQRLKPNAASDLCPACEFDLENSLGEHPDLNDEAQAGAQGDRQVAA